MWSSSSSSAAALSAALALQHLVFISSFIQVQALAPSTDPSEAAALNSVFQQWKISAGSQDWNISGELCSGAAINKNGSWDNYDPSITCECSYDNGSTCHITGLKVYAMDVVGVLPEELWRLNFLTVLNLGQNYLTGPISASVGNLTRMQYLSFGINALSGEIPKAIGNLTDLILLAFGGNNFSGPIPSELGNLVNLENLYVDSSGLSGEIPLSFFNLRKLKILQASDNDLTGRLPELIGNFSDLNELKLQGNSFEGPIPSTISNLTSLTNLRISDMLNGSSSLHFIDTLKSLKTLVLRNNKISATIPINMGEFRNLSYLDLSFNNISGQIPDSLFTMSSLSYLFLGNNRLSGNLPAQKSSSLLYIDVSYNFLSGSFPSWTSKQSLLNLVANNFTVESSNSSVLPAGLNCLQRNFPCNRGPGLYHEFAINSGGPQITSSDRTLFERDNETTGPASYYVTDTNKWALSNVGLFDRSGNSNYMTNSSASRFTNTLDSELFQTSRRSAGSLRYYGLGLENGNYTLSLLFAETDIPDTTSWKSRGRRVFDIYIQGNLVQKDFDIKKEAGGVTFRAVQKDYKALVSENVIEIHLFWAGKGTCCIPTPDSYGPSISAIKVTPDFIPSTTGPPNTKNRISLIVGVVAAGVVCVLSIFTILFYMRRSGKDNEDELLGMETRSYTFSYGELKAATDGFNPANKLGEGGFGSVYKGKLNDGRTIAVKQLLVASNHGKAQFATEIATISAVQHRNLVKLYGCCINGKRRLLVYEYLENRSLDQAVFGPRSLNLDWPTRFGICLGVARGLSYLHEESRIRIVHRDVKASNILLDSNLVPKISDFGLAKLYDDKKTHISTRVAGTIGYLAPEYALRGLLTEKADVFGFGVVALELVSGRQNTDQSLEDEKIYLLELAWQLHENNSQIELIDPELREFNEEEVKRVIAIALLCTQTSPTMRPPMSRVVAMLTGDTEVGAEFSKPGYLTDWKFHDETSFFTDALHSEAAASYYESATGSTGVESEYPLVSPMPLLPKTVGDDLDKGQRDEYWCLFPSLCSESTHYE